MSSEIGLPPQDSRARAYFKTLQGKRIELEGMLTLLYICEERDIPLIEQDFQEVIQKWLNTYPQQTQDS